MPTENLKAEEGLKPQAHEIKNEIEDTIEEVGKDSVAAPAVNETSEHPSPIQPAVEMAATDQVKDPLVNETKEHASENKSEAPPAIEVNDPVKDNAEDKDTKIQTELPSKINVLSPLESSKKAKEGQKWNDRDPEWQDYTKNIKSDLTSQEQSDDPVAIRKQVTLNMCYCSSSH